ncbi:hypothetical protein WJX72_012460 [[Myrmecia] bisecta]|uniref:Protein kinase domain-containing protein n=1 Tax=[Myrmecia] bisecta TaxID=41462 RepID=A0AAW1PIN6_9CHLO
METTSSSGLLSPPIDMDRKRKGEQLLLSRNAEIIHILDRCVRARLGKPPGEPEKRLAKEAYQNLASLALANPPQAIAGPPQRIQTFVSTARALGLLPLRRDFEPWKVPQQSQPSAANPPDRASGTSSRANGTLGGHMPPGGLTAAVVAAASGLPPGYAPGMSLTGQHLEAMRQAHPHAFQFGQLAGQATRLAIARLGPRESGPGSKSARVRASVVATLAALAVLHSGSVAGQLCPVTIDYAVSLGSGGVNAEVPIFFGKVGVINNGNVTIESWRLGWNFTDGESIQAATDLFDNTITPLVYNGSRVELEQALTPASNASQLIFPGQERSIGFLGTKATTNQDPSNAYLVAPVSDLAFNNLVCVNLDASRAAEPPTSPQQPQYQAVLSNLTIFQPTSLFQEYAPIVYTSLPLGVFPGSFTQFLVRLSNVASNETIGLERVKFQYWFNGPEGGSVPSADPSQQFEAVCSDTTTGCGFLTWNISPGLPDVRGARHVLTVGFLPGAGFLLPTNLSVVDGGRAAGGNQTSLRQNGVNVMEVLIRVQTRQFLAQMNSTLDYSFFDTPSSAHVAGNDTNIEPRVAIPNVRIPVLLDGTMVWGSEPTSIPLYSPPAAAPPQAANQPSYVQCADTSTPSTQNQSASATQVCGVSRKASLPDGLLGSGHQNWAGPRTPPPRALSHASWREARWPGSPGHQRTIAPSPLSDIVIPEEWDSPAKPAGLGMRKSASATHLPGEAQQGTQRMPYSASPFAGSPASARVTNSISDPSQRTDDIDSASSGGRAPRVLLLERKASSMPSLKDAWLAVGLDSTSTSSSSDHEPGSAPQRPKTWTGILRQVPGEALLPPAVQRHRKLASNTLPPLHTLAPPITLASPALPHIDMDVDYEAEIKPFLGRCLGTGGFGSVHACIWRGREVAVKRLPQLTSGDGADSKASRGQYDALVREIELSSKFASDRLVRVYGACLKDAANVCLIMELVAGGSLAQRIYDRHKRRMTYLEILQVVHEVAAGLAYLHPSVVHRDLKPQNILLDLDGRAKIADFGISRVKDPSKTYLTTTNDNGTPMYMAPEQFNGTRVDEKVDVYSLGCIANECFTRRQPWKEFTHFFQIIVQVAIKGERPKIDADCPDPLRRLIQKCWHQDPHQRPSCAEIMRLTDILIQQEIKRLSAWSPHTNAHAFPLPQGAVDM